jgi:hypothetical protein
MQKQGAHILQKHTMSSNKQDGAVPANAVEKTSE